MRFKNWYLILLMMLMALPDAAIAADADAPRELDVLYTVEWTGTPATLQVGANERDVRRTHELTAVDGTSFAGATHALCQQNKIEVTTIFGSGLIVGGMGKVAGITGRLAWASTDGGQNRKRGLYYRPGE